MRPKKYAYAYTIYAGRSRFAASRALSAFARILFSREVQASVSDVLGSALQTLLFSISKCAASSPAVIFLLQGNVGLPTLYRLHV